MQKSKTPSAQSICDAPRLILTSGVERADYLPAQLVGKLINPLNQSGGSFASDVYIGALDAAQREESLLLFALCALLLLLGWRARRRRSSRRRRARCYGKLNMN
jgi:hypothetical protein